MKKYKKKKHLCTYCGRKHLHEFTKAYKRRLKAKGKAT